ncbi:3-hydroxyacyl-CoA dehydrogenase NAD-binding domain-containing protein [Pseudohoeflea coraliihabitans]|uniref:Enoyl-CoA hydratase/isomerase family protein n=1 Tax=Pseudohoeflea coraliihabitans TaxID=2860393 RepID=A0ABS6WT60_9HYPH|nr:3-hydroxyacyl-CoA dehydrogenase NAD-binding domain-containing protein [Pseudohoeflea sp. DP4N28-3]MBW3098975.1 enoyl-CoA hydratase/isomerase family protein [Pseudohoeflea sp. DP4N28-3]
MIRYDIRPDGVAVLLWDLEGQAANVLTGDSIERYGELARRAIADPAVRGVVVASAKKDFLAGADLTKILPGDMDRDTYEKRILGFHRIYRDIETSGKPFVAALNGSTLGGGYELALACHYRIAADNPSARFGLPEVTLALLPGGGGTQRLPRLIGIDKALPLILSGKVLKVAEALDHGMLDAIASADQLLETACRKALELAAGDVVQPWDRSDAAPQVKDNAAFEKAAEDMRARTRGLQTAPERALASVREGMAIPFDDGIAIETRNFVDCCFDPQSSNTIRTSFFAVRAARKLASRPDGVPTRQFSRIGVLGAGMMGAGIAQIAAAAGIEVVLLDTTMEQAEKGRDGIHARLERRARGDRAALDKAEGLLARIEPTDDFDRLANVDLVVEAVFENRAVKADVTRRAVARMKPGTVFASNTSTLPITGLAEASSQPDLFIGMHFFSPVDRMALVEIIMGEQTSDTALAHALDFLKAVRKTPIAVRDGRGFYTSRVFATYIYEALEMLEEGVAPHLIEEGGLLTGLPMGPLALSDQLSIALAYKVQCQERADLGDAFRETAAYRVCRLMVDELGRKGRSDGAGYYDYSANGDKSLWPGLAGQFEPLADQPAPAELAERFLMLQSIETLRCLEEGVLLRPIDGDVGAVLGWGYPAFRGGPVAYVDTLGQAAFLARCEHYAARYGERYAPPENLRRMAANGERFYSAADPSRF